MKRQKSITTVNARIEKKKPSSVAKKPSIVRIATLEDYLRRKSTNSVHITVSENQNHLPPGKKFLLCSIVFRLK